MKTDFLQVSNGEAVKMDRIPHLPFDDFYRDALSIVRVGGQVVHYFAFPDGGKVRLMAVLRDDTLQAAVCDAPRIYPSMTSQCPQFHMFEREMAEQFGIRPEGHPWLKAVRRHAALPGAEDVSGHDHAPDMPGNHDYYAVAGEGVHEVGVGPVHAGVVEPGHFRFNCVGERVLNLEIRLGYQHRGVETLLPGAGHCRMPIIVESIAGDTAVGNGLCMSQGIEALAAAEPDNGARIIRTVALELERVANHIGDLGALSGDVAFLPPANYFGRMRGDFLNLTLRLCGNRFGKGLVRPGGTRFDLADDVRKEMNGQLLELTRRVKGVLDLLFTNSGVQSRFDHCGVVSHGDAQKLGLVGPAGRASGQAYDVRRCFPTEIYGQLDIPENAKSSGDVHARATVRAEEVLQSLDIIKALLNDPIKTRCVESGAHALLPDAFVVTLNEAWRGELSHCILTDGRGDVLRYKVKDPSFHNWSGLSMALRDTGISDFPLNNKSFNLSHCGFDL